MTDFLFSYISVGCVRRDVYFALVDVDAVVVVVVVVVAPRLLFSFRLYLFLPLL